MSEPVSLGLVEAASLIGKYVQISYDEYASSGMGYYAKTIVGKVENMRVISSDNGKLVVIGADEEIELKDIASYAIMEPGPLKVIRKHKDQHGRVPA